MDLVDGAQKRNKTITYDALCNQSMGSILSPAGPVLWVELLAEAMHAVVIIILTKDNTVLIIPLPHL